MTTILAHNPDTSGTDATGAACPDWCNQHFISPDGREQFHVGHRTYTTPDGMEVSISATLGVAPGSAPAHLVLTAGDLADGMRVMNAVSALDERRIGPHECRRIVVAEGPMSIETLTAVAHPDWCERDHDADECHQGTVTALIEGTDRYAVAWVNSSDGEPATVAPGMDRPGYPGGPVGRYDGFPTNLSVAEAAAADQALTEALALLTSGAARREVTR